MSNGGGDDGGGGFFEGDGGNTGGDYGGGGDGDPGTFTEVEYESYCERMQNAFAGVCVGFLLFFGSWPFLFWNEGRAVSRQEDLDEGRGILQQVGLTTINATIDKALDSKLIYVTGVIDGGNDVLYDNLFDINVTDETGGAVKYGRNSQMYQWKQRSETKTTKLSNGKTKKETTYSYEKVWSSSLIDSSNFKRQVTPSNPTSFLVPGSKLVSNDIGLGPFSLSADITSQIDWYSRWNDAPVNPSLFNFPGYTTSYSGGELRISKSTGFDSIGDHRVDFSIVMPDDISVVAKQGSSGQLEPYITEGGGKLLLFSRGTLSSDLLFNEAEQENILLTWVYRFVGFLAMVIGICLILNPIATAFDVLPFCGDALEGLIGGCIIPCIALCISIPISLLIISVAWLFYRPYFAVGIIVMLGLLAFFFIKYLKPKLSNKPPAQNPSNPEAKPANQGYDENVGQPEATAVPVGYEEPYKAENPVPPSTNPGFSPPPSQAPAMTTNTGGGYAYVPP